jgi:hypothetical protein
MEVSGLGEVMAVGVTAGMDGVVGETSFVVGVEGEVVCDCCCCWKEGENDCCHWRRS